MAVGLLGVGCGALVRHTAGALGTFPAVIFLPLLVLVVPAPWSSGVGRFTFLLAAEQVVSLHPDAGLLGPGLSLLVVLGWPAVVLAAAAVVLPRRDV